MPPLTTEHRDLPVRLQNAPAGLPEVPGGWTRQAWEVGPHRVSLVLPAVPDAFLDDADVHRRHAADEYMPYWAYLWPASLPMARLALNPPWPVGSEVLELGAGVGFVGLTALHRGDRVVFSDYDPQAVELTLFNARQAGFEAEGLVLDWRHPPDRQFSAILGCELLYEDRNHELLFNVLQRVLAPGGVAWFGDGGRVRAERFWRLAPEMGFEVRLFDEQLAPLSQPRFGQFQLVELRWKTRPSGE